MPYAAWEPRFSVGVAELDAQHRNLFDLINDFHDCVRRGLSREAVAKVIDALVQYARYHFSYEEKLMKKYGYTGVDGQVTTHQAFIDTMCEFQTRYEEGKLLAPMEVCAFLKKWLTDHVVLVDMRYAECFRKVGAA